MAADDMAFCVIKTRDYGIDYISDVSRLVFSDENDSKCLWHFSDEE